MMAVIRSTIGWGLFLALALTAVLVIRDNPHGSARLLQDVNARVSTYASQQASRLPSGRP